MKNKFKVVNIIGIIVILVLIVILLVVIFNDNDEDNKLSISDEVINNTIVLDENDVPKYISGDSIDTKVEGEDDVWSVLNELKNYYGFKNSEEEFNVISTSKNNNETFYKVNQKYKGIEVYGYQLVIAVDTNNEVISVQGNYFPNINISTYASKSKSKVKENYINSVDTENIEFLVDGEEKIYIKDNKAYLTYYFQVVDDIDGIYDIFISPSNEIIEKIILNDDIAEGCSENDDGYECELLGDDENKYTINLSKKTVLGLSDYYVFSDYKRNINIYDATSLGADFYNDDGSQNWFNALYYLMFTSLSKTPIQFDENFNNGIDASLLKIATSNMHTFSTVYDYYKNKIGIDSYDNNGAQIDVYVNVHNDALSPKSGLLKNASWSSGYFVIGGYDGRTLGSSIDIIGHEFTHAVSGNIVSFVGKGASGSLNESYSDIIGSCIEGEDFEVGKGVYYVRSMSDPNSMNNPKEVGGDYYFPTDTNYYNDEKIAEIIEDNPELTLETWTDYDDGGEHLNSTVPDYAAYLIYTNGGVDGFDELAKLYYDSLFYLTSTSDFEDSAYAVLSAANRLGYSSDKIEIIKNAFIETKMLDIGYAVTGSVSDKDTEESLSNVTVSLTYENNSNVYYTTLTDNDGSFTFSNIQEGEYTISFEKNGYSSLSEEINISEDSIYKSVMEKINNENYKNMEVIFVMDVSNSMEENDPEDIRKKIFVNILSSLDNNAKVALITFTSTSNVVNDGLTDKTVDKKILMTDVFNIANDDGLSSTSGTNGRAGLSSALELFTDSTENAKYIIFLTDGADNKTGAYKSYEEIVEVANEKKIKIFTIGLSDSVESTNLEYLSSETGGKYYFANSNSDLKKFDSSIFNEIN